MIFVLSYCNYVMCSYFQTSLLPITLEYFDVLVSGYNKNGTFITHITDEYLLIKFHGRIKKHDNKTIQKLFLIESRTITITTMSEKKKTS